MLFITVRIYDATRKLKKHLYWSGIRSKISKLMIYLLLPFLIFIAAAFISMWYLNVNFGWILGVLIISIIALIKAKKDKSIGKGQYVTDFMTMAMFNAALVIIVAVVHITARIIF